VADDALDAVGRVVRAVDHHAVWICGAHSVAVGVVQQTLSYRPSQSPMSLIGSVVRVRDRAACVGQRCAVARAVVGVVDRRAAGVHL